MKQLFFTLFLSFAAAQFTIGQTAVNFSVNDCNGDPHDLFSELNAGKIVILAWVMPCPGCVEGSFAASTVAANYETSNPGKVVLYVVDDYGNSPCHTVTQWTIDNNVNATTCFSDPAISMSDYGISGMPKVVVLGGGTSHSIFYNQNNSTIDSLGIDLAVQQALQASITEKSASVAVNLFPNPTKDLLRIEIQTNGAAVSSCVIQNNLGQTLGELKASNTGKGTDVFEIETKTLPAGIYFVTFTANNTLQKQRFEVIH